MSLVGNQVLVRLLRSLQRAASGILVMQAGQLGNTPEGWWQCIADALPNMQKHAVASECGDYTYLRQLQAV